MSLYVDIRKKLGGFTLETQFEAADGVTGILGASGCGKSMTLRCIAGIVKPDEGHIELDGKVLFNSREKINLRPQERHVGLLFQNYALFPNMTVRQNLMTGLKAEKTGKKEAEIRIQEMLDKFELKDLEKHKPAELSGGQQQRVALARIMAYKPDVILLDEPFSALDMYLKDRLQQELQELFEDYEGTVIMVSHSRDEVYRFSEELLIIDQGQIVAAGKTKELFQNPQRKEAARLTGCKNFTRAVYVDEHTAELTDWGITLRTEQRNIPENINYIGYRAHDFVPVWGGCGKNQIPFALESKAALPFEDNYYIKPANAEANPSVISWFVQRENQEKIREKGMPDALELVEEEVLFLE